MIFRSKIFITFIFFLSIAKCFGLYNALPNIPFLQVDSVLLNLFTNSIKYSSPRRKPKITVSSKKKGKNIIVDFKDNGLGINMERHGKKLFGMYKTFHQHEDAKGIGLFITKNQIEAMDGKIEVESAVDKGTTFRVTLCAE